MNYDAHYSLTTGGQVCSVLTGELVDLKEIEKLMKEELKGRARELRNLQEILNIPLTKLTSTHRGIEYKGIVIKENYTFNRGFRVDTTEMMKENNLSVYALAFIARFQPHIYFPYNYIVVNSQHPSIKDYMEILKISERKVFELLNELEAAYVIKRIKTGKELVIYFNPFLYSSGNPIYIDTYLMWKYNPYNPEMWKIPSPLDL